MAWLRWGLAGIYSAGLLYLLWSPPSGHPPLFPHDDKVFHCLSFVGIGASWWWTVRRTGIVWIIGGMLAVGSEVVQGLLPWPRSTDVFDMLADLLGVAIGVAAARWLVARRT